MKLYRVVSSFLRHRILSPFIMLIVCGLQLLCLSLAATAEEQTVTIGAVLALTGPYPKQGNAFREGIELAEDEINRTGGVAGKKFRVQIQDSVNSAKDALNGAQKLIQDDVIVAALMSSYPEYRTAGMEFQRKHIPSIALWDSSPELDEMGDYIFGIGPWTPSAGTACAEFAAKNLKARTAVIVASVDPWAELIAGYFKKDFEAAGGKVLDQFSLNPDTSDFRTILLKVKAKNPDVIYAPLIDNIPAFYSQKMNLGITIPSISSDIIAPDLIQTAPVAFEGVYQSMIRDPQNTLSRDLFARYQKKFGREPALPWFVATAYDGVNILAHAIRSAGPDGKKVKDFLYTVKNFHGATQSFTFEPGGSAKQLAGMAQIRSGAFVWVWP